MIFAGAKARLSPYANRQLWVIALLGIASGLPFGALADPLSAWLLEQGLSLTSIGLFAYLSLPYTLKPLWAPLLDHYRPPLGLGRLGRRRGWLLLIQLLALAAIVGLGSLNPAREIWLVGGVVLLIAFASASQDIVVDALRVESLSAAQAPAGAAVMVPAYRIGQLLAGAGGLALAQLAGWQVAWAAVGGCMIVGMVGTLLIRPQPPQQDAAPSPEQSPEQLFEQPAAPPSGWQTLRASFLNPLRHLLHQPNAWLLLLIILLYRLPDAFLAPMRVPLLLHVGFDKITLAEINKLVGFGATVLGGFVAHGLIQRLTLARVLWWGALAQGASNLLFLPLLRWGADRTLLTYAVAMDNLLGGIVSVAMVILLTRACRHPGYTASQYAVLSAVMSLSRTLVSGLTGLAADSLGWGGFLILTALLAIPVLPLLPRLRKSGLLF